MSEEEFWNLSPREFIARRKAWEAEQDRWDFRAAIVATAAANAYHFRRADDRPYDVQDFLPRKRPAIRLKTEQDVEEFALALAKSMGAELPPGSEALCRRLKS